MINYDLYNSVQLVLCSAWLSLSLIIGPETLVRKKIPQKIIYLYVTGMSGEILQTKLPCILECMHNGFNLPIMLYPTYIDNQSEVSPNIPSSHSQLDKAEIL